MTPSDQDILADIERNEQWLRDHAGPHPRPVSVEHLKLRVRIAADEEWLRPYSSPKPGEDCIRRVHQAVRRELVRVAADGTPASRFQPFADLPSRVASLVAAAVLVFAVVIGLLPPGSSATPTVALEDFVEVCAAANEQDRWGLEQLRDEVDDLEARLSEPYWPQHDLYDDVDDDVRDLMDELGSPRDARGNPA